MKHQASTLLLPVSLCLLACNGESLSLGGNGAPLEPPVDEVVCGDGLRTYTRLEAQAGIDALVGCEVFRGDLAIVGGAPLTLAPLASLRRVEGNLTLEALDSLAGLEALEGVSGLKLSSLIVADLTPLRNLRSVAVLPSTERTESSYLNIEGCNGLGDLSGLEQVADYSQLNLTANQHLLSLNGLDVPPALGQVFIYGSPELVDVSALAPLIQVENLSIGQTGITDVDGFSLRKAENVSLGANPALTNLHGLSGLSVVRTLFIEDNDSLVDIALPALAEVHLISITGNAVLTSVPEYAANTGEGIELLGSLLERATSYEFADLAFQVGDNPLLTQIALPTGYDNVQQVAIFSNPNVQALDLTRLERTDGLIIVQNQRLASVTLPEALRVGDLTIVDNPALSVAPFASALTQSTEVTGNLDQLAP